LNFVFGYCIATAPDPALGLLVCNSQHWNSNNLTYVKSTQDF